MPDPTPSSCPVFAEPYLDVFGQQAHILMDGSATGGASSVVSQLSPPGSVVPPHAHPCTDELFHILEGEFEFWLEGKWTPVAAGTVVYAPRGAIHGFRNTGGTMGKLVAVYTPAGFEQLLVEIDRLTRAGALTPASLGEVSQRYGVITLDEAAWQDPATGF